MKLYENGILLSAIANSTTIIDNDVSVFIGSQSDGPGSVFNGVIDDVLIYNRGISQEEVEAIFNAEVSSTRNRFLDLSIEVSPNPTNGILNIQNNSEYRISSYTLSNAAGARIETNAFQNEIDISCLLYTSPSPRD